MVEGNASGRGMADQPPVIIVAKDPKKEVDEVLDFYKFALRPDASYQGTVVFDVKKSETNPSFLVSVRVDSKNRELITTYFTLFAELDLCDPQNTEEGH